MAATLMTTRTLGVSDRVVVESAAARTAIGVASFALLTALGAHVALPLPFTPVPLTLQTLFVVLSGAVLGARRGAAAQLLYLGAGLAGAPIFAYGGGGPLYLLSPTAGYLLAFPVAAALSGWFLSSPGRYPLRAAAALVALLVVHAVGVAWLAVWTGEGLAAALALGSIPFLPGALVKAGVVAGLVPGLRRRWMRAESW